MTHPSDAVKALSCLLLSSVFLIAPVHAQNTSGCTASGQLQLSNASGAGASEVKEERSQPLAKRSAVTDQTPAVSVTPTTEAESVVQRRIRKKGVHVVHFWAPWCGSASTDVLDGWADLVAQSPNVTFTFVTMWNDGDPAREVLEKATLPNRAVTVVQPDLEGSNTESVRRYSFLSHSLPRVPATWIFHNSGQLAFALNDGELPMETIQSLLQVTRQD